MRRSIHLIVRIYDIIKQNADNGTTRVTLAHIVCAISRAIYHNADNIQGLANV